VLIDMAIADRQHDDVLRRLRHTVRSHYSNSSITSIADTVA
jgi:hypothetical protein